MPLLLPQELGLVQMKYRLRPSIQSAVVAHVYPTNASTVVGWRLRATSSAAAAGAGDEDENAGAAEADDDASAGRQIPASVADAAQPPS